MKLTDLDGAVDVVRKLSPIKLIDTYFFPDGIRYARTELRTDCI